MMNLKKISCFFAIVGLLITGTAFNVKAADGDVYNLGTKTVTCTRTEYLSDTNKYKEIVTLTTANPDLYGIEKNSKVFKLSNINTNIGNKIKTGVDLITAISKAYDGITEEGNASDYSQVEEDFDVATIE